MKQVTFGSSLGDDVTSGTNYFSLMAPPQHIAGAPTNDFGRSLVAVDGTLRAIYLSFDNGPGAGKTATFTLQVNGVDTAVVFTVVDSATTATWSGSYDLNQDDRVSLKAVGTAAQANCPLNHVAWEFDTATPFLQGYATCISQSGLTGPRYTGVFAGGSVWNPSSTERRSVCPIAGTITGMRGRLQTTGHKRFYIVLNGVKQDGTGGTVDTELDITCAGSPNNGFVEFELPVVAGDVIYYQMDHVAGDVQVELTCSFESAEVGRCIVASDGNSGTIDNNNSDEYAPMGNPSRDAWTTNGPTWRVAGGFTNPVVIESFYGNQTTAPGTGNSRTYWVEVGGADTAATFSIADLGLSGGIGDLSVPLEGTDTVQLHKIGVSVPDASTNAYFAIGLIVGTGQTTQAALWTTDTGIDDAGTPYSAFERTRPVSMGNLLHQFAVMASSMVAASASGVEVAVRLIRDHGRQQKTQTFPLTPAGSETHVIRRADKLALRELKAIQVEIRDTETPAGRWEIDHVALKVTGDQQS